MKTRLDKETREEYLAGDGNWRETSAWRWRLERNTWLEMETREKHLVGDGD